MPVVETAFWVTILAGAISFIVLVAGAIGFLVRKQQRMSYLRWRLAYELRAFDVNYGEDFKEVMGYDGPITMFGLRRVASDEQAMQFLEEHYPGFFQQTFEIVDLANEYIFWSRVFHLGDDPGNLGLSIEPGGADVEGRDPEMR